MTHVSGGLHVASLKGWVYCQTAKAPSKYNVDETWGIFFARRSGDMLPA